MDIGRGLMTWSDWLNWALRHSAIRRSGSMSPPTIQTSLIGRGRNQDYRGWQSSAYNPLLAFCIMGAVHGTPASLILAFRKNWRVTRARWRSATLGLMHTRP